MENIIENKTKINATWEELGISNDFLFGKVMQNPELYRKEVEQ